MNGLRRRYRDEEGFTLLELLVTLAVLSFLASIVLGATFSVRRIGQQIVSNHAEEEKVAAAQMILRSRIAGLRALTRGGRVVPVVDVEGDDQRFSFYAPPTDSDAPSSLRAFRLLRMATGDLMLFSSPLLTEDVDLRSSSILGWKPMRLLEGVDELSISYFGPAPGGNGARWQRFWSERQQPPQLVRIGIRFARDDRRYWPDLVVRPTVTMNVACQLDAVTPRCDETGQP